MASAYELIEETRPRIRRDVLFTQSPSGVLFHNADGGFNLSGASAYRFAALVVPHLDGNRRVRDLCAGLGPRQRDMIANLVSALYDRGFARDVPVPAEDEQPLPVPVAERFAPQIDYIDHYVGDAAARFRAFRGARVAVLGEDEVACWCVLSLIRNGAAEIAVTPGIRAVPEQFAQILAEVEQLREQGCECEITELSGDGRIGWASLDSRDLVLVTGSDAPSRVLALLEAGIPEGIRLLPAWSFGEKAIIGPLMTRDGSGCLVCAALRLGADGDPASAADLWSAVALPRTVAGPRTPTGPLAGMLGNLLGYEVFRVTTGALPAETAGGLVIQDLDSLDAWSEPLFPHPRCPYCASAVASEAPPSEPPASEPPASAELAPEESAAELTTPAQPAPGLTEPDESGDEPAPVELDDPAVVLKQLESVSVLVQAHAGVFRSFGDDAWNQTPIKIGTVRLGLGHGERREITAFDVHHVAGARIRALQGAARVYADHVIPVGGVLRGAELEAARSQWRTIGPSRLSATGGTITSSAQVSAWARAYRWDHGRETVLVPAAALRTLGPDNGSLICLPTSAGTGAGGSRAEALIDGLLSALALDALVAAVRGRIPVRRVELQSLDSDAELVFLARSARNLGVEVELLDLGGPEVRPAPVLLARALSPDDGEPRWAVGCAADRRQAAGIALRDLLGAVQLERQLPEGGRMDGGDPLLTNLDPRALAVEGEAGPAAEVPRAPGETEEILRRVRAAGDEVVVTPIEAPDLAAGGIAVAKVLLVHENADAR